MTEEEVQGHIDHLKAATMDLPWTHDPRTGPLTQTTDEQLGQAMQALSDHPETVERIGKATDEDIDGMPPGRALPPDRTQTEDDARYSARDVFRVIDATFGTPEELRAKLDACMRGDPTRLQCTWEQAKKVDFTDRNLTLYEFYGGGKRLTWASDGTVFVQEGFWEPGEAEALVHPETEISVCDGDGNHLFTAHDGVLSPEREEFSAWLERDGLREER